MKRLEQKALIDDALSGKLDSAEKRRLIKRSERTIKLRYSRPVQFGLVLWVGIGFLSASTLLNLAGLDPSYTDLAHVITIVIALVVLLYFESQQLTRQRKWIALDLLRRNIRPNLCLICGCNLRGTTAQACPECGTALAPVEADATED